MGKLYDVTTLGEILIDFTPAGSKNGIPHFAQNPGGAPLNVLAQASLLGGKTAFIGKVGRDMFGAALRKAMEQVKVDTSALVEDENFNTTLAFVSLGEDGERSFSFYRHGCADLMITPEEVDREKIKNSHVFHFGSLSLIEEPARSATLEAISEAKKAGCIVSYDPNYRPLLWGADQNPAEEMKKPLPNVDILKVSDDEMEMLTGTKDFERGSKILADYGAALVLVSRGGDGSAYRCGGRFGLVPPYKVSAVDTTGAGDAFLGAILYSLRDLSLDELKDLPEEKLVEIVKFGNAAGAKAVEGLGAIPAMGNAEQIRAIQQK